MRKFSAFICLSLFVLLGFSPIPHNVEIRPLPDLVISSTLKLTPSNPAVGEVVTAEFTIRNTGSAEIYFNNLGAGGRGPGCNEWDCANYQDFPFVTDIALGVDQTYNYRAERIFWETGPYFAQIAGGLSSGDWIFAGSRLNYTVQDGLQISTPLTLSENNPYQHQLSFGEFGLTNAGPRSLTFLQVGIAVRGPDCVLGDWACPTILDFPFDEDVTMAAGQTKAFAPWQSFHLLGAHFASITVQDALGSWHFLSDLLNFEVDNRPNLIRSTSWQFGVHYHPTWDDRDVDRLTMAHRSGVDLIRLSVSWQLMEPSGRGQFDDDWYLPALTNVVEVAASLGIDVMIVLLETPCWASSDPNKNCAANAWNPYHPPHTNGDYASALYKLMALFGDEVSAWEIWNEPNIGRFWQPEPNSADYVQLLKAAHTAIKSQYPNSVVLAGSLAGSDIDFLLEMYAAGAENYYDALALHPYSGTRPPGDCPDLRSAFQCGIEAIRSMMLFHDDDKPIWLTEYGWSSTTSSAGVGLSNQSTYLQQTHSMVNQWDYVPVATWYNLIDTHSSLPQYAHEDHMGLFYRNLTPKPAADWLNQEQFTFQTFLPILSEPTK